MPPYTCEWISVIEMKGSRMTVLETCAFSIAKGLILSGDVASLRIGLGIACVSSVSCLDSVPQPLILDGTFRGETWVLIDIQSLTQLLRTPVLMMCLGRQIPASHEFAGYTFFILTSASQQLYWSVPLLLLAWAKFELMIKIIMQFN